MKVKKHHQLKNNSATTLSGVRPLGTLFVFFFVSSFPVQAVSLQETTTPKTFADWCLNKNNLSAETRHTVDVLLRVAKTTDCNQASKLLSVFTELDLRGYKITDLKPLSTLTNLTELSLHGNQITDLKPLSTLTNLTNVYLSNNQISDLRPLSTLTSLNLLALSNNQITDLRPLSGLTNLTVLYLDNNQIASVSPLSGLTNLARLTLDNNQITDFRPLSGLTKLTYLVLGNNPSLTDKTCPVKPESICRLDHDRVATPSSLK